MHLHLVRVPGHRKPLRPAKVVMLDARRQARVEDALKRLRPDPPRAA